MGTGFIVYVDDRENEEKDVTILIPKALQRLIAAEMEKENPDDEIWVGRLQAVPGIHYLYVGSDEAKQSCDQDFGPAFYKVIKRLQRDGPPDYYYADTFRERERDDLEKMIALYEEIRPDARDG